MSQRRIIPDPILMLITILVVTGFQVYWLKNNYDRERRSLQIKTNVKFQETVRHLQALKLKLREPAPDSSGKDKVHIILDEDINESHEKIRELPRREIVTMVNAMREKVKDSAKTNLEKSSVVITWNKEGPEYPRKARPGYFEKRVEGDSTIYKILYGVDSLQDSLKVKDISYAYMKKLKEDLLPVPFTVTRLAKVNDSDDLDFSDVTIGFARPVTYHLELGNTFNYLLGRIMMPILFSIFLVGVTILSFVVMYRSLLKQRRLAELKNEFIGNITHELKTPIATVGVAIEALKNFNAMQDPKRTREYLDISANELQRLSLLVDKVLKLSMFEKKEIDLKFEPFELREVVDEVVASMRLQIEKYNATVSVEQTGETVLEADRLHLLSIVFNLLDNALKYSREQPSIKMELDGNDEAVQLKVSDNGIGIAPEYKSKVFEKFFRVPTGNTHNAKGYGLGLSYVAQVVQKHKGRIAIESALNEGTTITITLPKKAT